MKLKYVLRLFVGFGVFILAVFLPYFLHLRICFPPEIAEVKRYLLMYAELWIRALCHPRNLILGAVTLPLFLGLFCWHYNRKWTIILASYAVICYNPLSIVIATLGRAPQYMAPYYKMMMSFIE